MRGRCVACESDCSGGCLSRKNTVAAVADCGLNLCLQLARPGGRKLSEFRADDLTFDAAFA